MWLAGCPLEGRQVFIDAAHQIAVTRASRPRGYSCTHTRKDRHRKSAHRNRRLQESSKQNDSEESSRWTEEPVTSLFPDSYQWKPDKLFSPSISRTHRLVRPGKNVKLLLILYIHAHISWTFRGCLNPGNHTNNHVYSTIERTQAHSSARWAGVERSYIESHFSPG